MQIVIDIPDHYYENNIKKELPIILSEDNVIGILPKGHGKLADLDAALKCVEDCEDCEDKTYAIALFDWAMSKRVVLEADKDDKE